MSVKLGHVTDQKKTNVLMYNCKMLEGEIVGVVIWFSSQ